MNSTSIVKISAIFVLLISLNLCCRAFVSPEPIDGIFYARNANELNELIKTGNVVVDFHREKSCPPCRMFAPIFAKVAASTPNVIFVKVDTDVYRPQDIRGVPTIIFYKDGKQVLSRTGAMQESQFRSLISSTFGL